MKILLFGKNGQVGWELNRALAPLGEIVALGRQEADFSNPEYLREIVRETSPDVIVNAAAYTAVDRAEEEKQLSELINATAPAVLAQEAKHTNALLVHYSTDYVFDGASNSPYQETDAPNPINQYGRTKLAGERAVHSSGCDYLIFRTSWVYASRGKNFLLAIIRLARKKNELRIVADQIGSPTSARLVAEATAICLFQSCREIEKGIFASGLYHLSASGHTSWHGFAKEILGYIQDEIGGKMALSEIHAISTDEYQVLAERPVYSRLSSNALEQKFNLVMPGWQVPLRMCLEELFESRIETASPSSD